MKSALRRFACVLLTGMPACSGLLIDDGGSEAWAVVTGVVRDASGLPAQGALVALHQFRNSACDGDDPGSLPPRPTDTAGRFIIQAGYPFSRAVDGCVTVWAVDPTTAAASDSVSSPVAFRTTPPYDTVSMELTLAP